MSNVWFSIVKNFLIGVLLHRDVKCIYTNQAYILFWDLLYDSDDRSK